MEKHSIVLQSNEVGGSYHMEKEGLSWVLDFLQKERKIHVEVLVTDRHRQINKWLREITHYYGEITHYYNVWHVAKGNAEWFFIIYMYTICIIRLPKET